MINGPSHFLKFDRSLGSRWRTSYLNHSSSLSLKINGPANFSLQQGNPASSPGCSLRWQRTTYKVPVLSEQMLRLYLHLVQPTMTVLSKKVTSALWSCCRACKHIPGNSENLVFKGFMIQRFGLEMPAKGPQTKTIAGLNVE